VRVKDHPILGKGPALEEVKIKVDGKELKAYEGEMIASALTAAGIKVFRYTSKNNEPRGVFCAIGRCTDCVMVVNGIPNVRTCVTPVKNNMVIQTQEGLGQWKEGGQTV
jgi:predicted molibdopterin-dependent oxidoreductase YjgC